VPAILKTSSAAASVPARDRHRQPRLAAAIGRPSRERRPVRPRCQRTGRTIRGAIVLGLRRNSRAGARSRYGRRARRRSPHVLFRALHGSIVVEKTHGPDAPPTAIAHRHDEREKASTLVDLTFAVGDLRRVLESGYHHKALISRSDPRVSALRRSRPRPPSPGVAGCRWSKTDFEEPQPVDNAVQGVQ